MADGLAVAGVEEGLGVLVGAALEGGDGLAARGLVAEAAEEGVAEVVEVEPEGGGREGEEAAGHVGEAEHEVGGAVGAVPGLVPEEDALAGGVGDDAAGGADVDVPELDAVVELVGGGVGAGGGDVAALGVAGVVGVGLELAAPVDLARLFEGHAV